MSVVCSVMDDIAGDKILEHNQNENSATSTGPMVWIPTVVESKRPKEGMPFASIDDAFRFYNDYAKEGGFGVRKSSNRIDKRTGEEIFKTYVCYKEGTTMKQKYPDTNDGPKRRRTTTREQCRALLSLKKNEKGLWIVVKFIEGHSHGLLSPSKTQFLSSHRDVSGPQRALLETLNEVNVGTSQAMSSMEIEAGGHEYIGCQVRDLYNFKRHAREKLKGNDAQIMITNFEQQKKKNQAFFYRYEVDSRNRLTRIFWADPTCRLNYGFFGDVVVFDTTYKTNRYDMIFTSFTGVNHHFQSVYFAFGFLHDETAESLCWLFRSFLECMPGDAPKSIITNQDPAMAKTIRIVFPNIFHRWCIWHITQKLPTKLGSKLYKSDFAASFHDLAKNCETPQEFEDKWQKLISLHELEADKWLAKLYDKRHKWVNAYLKHTFFAGMRSSQRSESHHSVLNKYISPHHSFVEFISKLKLVLSQQRTNELQADQESLTGKPKVKTSSLLEAHMADVYTKNIFYMFQDEFMESGFGYSWQMDTEDENEIHYVVRRLPINDKRRTVIFDKKSRHLSCSCQKFEFEGIPCGHLLLMLRNVGINDLPSRYILKRWCKDAKKGTIIDSSGEQIVSNKHDPQAIRSRELRYITDKLVEQGRTSEKRFELMKKILQNALYEFQTTTSVSYDDNHNSNKEENEVDKIMHFEESMSTINEGAFVNEPSQCRLKGCGERMKTRMEKIMSTPRLCRACGKRGVQHDSRNCPDKKKWVQENDESEENLDDEGYHMNS